MKPLENLSILELRRAYLLNEEAIEQEKIWIELSRRGVVKPSKDLLKRVVSNYRGTVTKWFSEVVKKHRGISDPKKMLKFLKKDREKKIQEHQKKGKADLREVNEAFLKLLKEHKKEALEMASWVMCYESLTEPEKEGLKERKREESKPSRKQKSYLISLGHLEEVNTRGEAKKLIEALKKKQGNGPTAKQTKFLKTLGHQGEVETKEEASKIISELVQKRDEERRRLEEEKRIRQEQELNEIEKKVGVIPLDYLEIAKLMRRREEELERRGIHNFQLGFPSYFWRTTTWPEVLLAIQKSSLGWFRWFSSLQMFFNEKENRIYLGVGHNWVEKVPLEEQKNLKNSLEDFLKKLGRNESIEFFCFLHRFSLLLPKFRGI